MGPRRSVVFLNFNERESPPIRMLPGRTSSNTTSSLSSRTLGSISEYSRTRILDEDGDIISRANTPTFSSGDVFSMTFAPDDFPCNAQYPTIRSPLEE